MKTISRPYTSVSQASQDNAAADAMHKKMGTGKHAKPDSSQNVDTQTSFSRKSEASRASTSPQLEMTSEEFKTLKTKFLAGLKLDEPGKQVEMIPRELSKEEIQEIRNTFH